MAGINNFINDGGVTRTSTSTSATALLSTTRGLSNDNKYNYTMSLRSAEYSNDIP